MSANVTGASVNRRPCHRCGKLVGGFFGGNRFQPARHNTPRGGPCRSTAADGDHIPDPRGCAPCSIIDTGGSGFCRKHKRAGIAKGAVASTRELIEQLAFNAGIKLK